jgi:hypothetical protein
MAAVRNAPLAPALSSRRHDIWSLLYIVTPPSGQSKVDLIEEYLMGFMAGVKIKSHHLGQPGRMVAGLMNLIPLRRRDHAAEAAGRLLA